MLSAHLDSRAAQRPDLVANSGVFLAQCVRVDIVASRAERIGPPVQIGELSRIASRRAFSRASSISAACIFAGFGTALAVIFGEAAPRFGPSNIFKFPIYKMTSRMWHDGKILEVTRLQNRTFDEIFERALNEVVIAQLWPLK